MSGVTGNVRTNRCPGCKARQDDIEALQAENMEQARLLGMSAERELAAQSRIAELEAELAAARDQTASAWRNGVTNTIAVIDLIRKQHKPAPHNKAFAVFDCALNGALDDWFKATRSAKPTTYEEAERAWQDFRALAGGTTA